MKTTLKQQANALRFLSMDAVQRAQSGHPGMPMGMADIATVLWQKYLRHHPRDPHWINRDRFVLSNGHGSMLLYALLHLSGYALTIDDLKAFRQLHSKTPGHPEFGVTPGVETTTGPLGQGLANAVGMAIAEKLWAKRFNQPDFNIVDHHTYVFVGDGCLMEGISHEVCSLAGTLGLGKLIVFWDDNGISIDGAVGPWFSEKVPDRFKAYGFQVIDGVDGHDAAAIDRAIEKARADHDRPSFIACKTHIGYGSPSFADRAACHGAPLGEDEIERVRAALDWPFDPFEIPEALYATWNAETRGVAHLKAWQAVWVDYQAHFPKQATLLKRYIDCDMPADWTARLEHWAANVLQSEESTIASMATRQASAHCLAHLSDHLPELFGGSADLSGSNGTYTKKHCAISHDHWQGNYLHYGVREFGMFAIMNGMALHGGFIPYGGTFLTFIDYGRNAIRLSAMMQQKVIYILTHDSIGLGEDGPTHQPIEQASILRLTPGVQVWRPADWLETVASWQSALTYQGPSCLLLSRQALPLLPHQEARLQAARQGAYVVWQSHSDFQVLLLATGSEVSLALAAAKTLWSKHDLQVRVVSMPCAEVFATQSETQKKRILPDTDGILRVAIEAGSSTYWKQYVGQDGMVLGIDRYGESAPAPQVFEALGLTEARVVEAVRTLQSTKKKE